MSDTDAAGGRTTAAPASTPTLSERFGTWFFAVTAVIVMPLLPLLVEAVKNNLEIKPETFFLTSAVMAVGYGFSSESNLFRASYTLLFFFSIGLDFHADDVAGKTASLEALAPPGREATGKWLFGHPGYYVIAVCMLHAIERLYWHVGQKKKFPDWLK